MIKNMIMNIETTKLELMQLLLKTEKKGVLTKIKAVFEQESSAFYSNKTSDLQQKAKASLEAIEKGETRSIQEFKNEVNRWKEKRTI